MLIEPLVTFAYCKILCMLYLIRTWTAVCIALSSNAKERRFIDTTRTMLYVYKIKTRIALTPKSTSKEKRRRSRAMLKNCMVLITVNHQNNQLPN